MKAKIWVLCTVLTDENAPAMPAVFANETEGRAAYDNAIRAEWDNWMNQDEAVRTPATRPKPKTACSRSMAPNGVVGN